MTTAEFTQHPYSRKVKQKPESFSHIFLIRKNLLNDSLLPHRDNYGNMRRKEKPVLYYYVPSIGLKTRNFEPNSKGNLKENVS